MLIDAIVECDDELMLKYLDEGNLSAAELEAALPKSMACGTVIPIFCCASKKEVGIDELLDAISKYTPAPSHAHIRLEHTLRHDKPIDTSENADFFGQVFKTVNDKFVGNLAFIRVLAGKMDTEHPLMNLRTNTASRVSHLLMMQGKTHQKVTEAYPGDIVAVAKVDGLHIGDTVAYKATAPKLPEPEFPKPMFGLAIEPKNRGDEQKISQSLTKYTEEDPTFKVTHDHQTHEMVINGVSQLHPT
jgi:elongation factor G